MTRTLMEFIVREEGSPYGLRVGITAQINLVGNKYIVTDSDNGTDTKGMGRDIISACLAYINRRLPREGTPCPICKEDSKEE